MERRRSVRARLVEAADAGRLLREEGYVFDLAYTSLLKRAIRTLWIALDVLDRMWIPIVKDWRLNERHYGALEGLNKAETAAKHGEAQVKNLAPELRHPAASPQARRSAPSIVRPEVCGAVAAGAPSHRIAQRYGCPRHPLLA